MSSLTKRAVILIACRVMNYGVLLLSPIFLVRILDMTSYGQYREFVMYAMLLSGIIGFAVNTNFLYFLPKYPEKERNILTNAVVLVLITSGIGIAGIVLARDLLRARMSFEYIYALAAYIAFFVNFDFFESYWLGKKRTDYVLYYSSARTVIRTLAIIAAAYLTHDVHIIIAVLVVAEAGKCLLMLSLFRKSFAREIDYSLMRLQLGYIVPLGSSALITLLNYQLANLTISLKMGVERLALYSIGSHQIPIINIVRTSVMDVLFPEMAQADEAGRLELWRRANIIFCFIIFPVYAVLFYFARTVIEVLFTAQYLTVVPLFRIYLSTMVLHCFEMGTPLRAMSRTKYYIAGSILTLCVNIAFILVFFGVMGFITPGVAFILGEAAAALFLAKTILALYHLKLRKLYFWRKILLIAGAGIASIPALFASHLIHIGSVKEAILCSSAYLIIYFSIVRKLRIVEVETLTRKFISYIRKPVYGR